MTLRVKCKSDSAIKGEGTDNSQHMVVEYPKLRANHISEISDIAAAVGCQIETITG